MKNHFCYYVHRSIDFVFISSFRIECRQRLIIDEWFGLFEFTLSKIVAVHCVRFFCLHWMTKESPLKGSDKSIFVIQIFAFRYILCAKDICVCLLKTGDSQQTEPETEEEIKITDTHTLIYHAYLKAINCVVWLTPNALCNWTISKAVAICNGFLLVHLPLLFTICFVFEKEKEFFKMKTACFSLQKKT